MPPNDDPLYLTADEVVAIHNAILNIVAGSADESVRDVNLLESALFRPRTAAFYEGADLVRQAATLL